MRQIIKCSILLVLLLILVIGVTKVFLVDYASYIENQRQDVLAAKNLIHCHGVELGESARELTNRYLRKGNRLYESLQGDIVDLVGFISAVSLLMFLILKHRTINILKVPLFVRYADSRGFRTFFRDCIPFIGVMAISVACYYLMVAASMVCMKRMQWHSVACADTGCSVSDCSLIHMLESIDQVLVVAKVINLIYYSSTLFVAFVVTVPVLWRMKTLRIEKTWLDGLIGVSLFINAVVLFLIWVLCFGPLSYQSVKTFEVLASGSPFSEIERRIGSGRECVPVRKCGNSSVEREFLIHPSAQFYPVSHKAYSFPARFPPGFFLVHVGSDGYVEHLRFYSSDGAYGDDGVRR